MRLNAFGLALHSVAGDDQGTDGVRALKHTPMGDVTETNRGFQIIQFRDRYGSACSLQQSSLADFTTPGSSAIWLGVESMPFQTRMHLSLEQVKALIPVLEMWVRTGSFAE